VQRFNFRIAIGRNVKCAAKIAKSTIGNCGDRDILYRVSTVKIDTPRYNSSRVTETNARDKSFVGNVWIFVDESGGFDFVAE